MAKYYTLKPQVTPLTKGSDAKGSNANASKAAKDADEQPKDDPFIRAEAEDDDGYDPYSDRPPTPEPQFQADPWD